MPHYIFDIDHPWTIPWQERRMVIGGKAANLNLMREVLGLPVPPAFTVSTATCNQYLADRKWPEGLDDELREHMRHIEVQVGREFGAANDPLLVSVRSGAPVSMPGMMDTILNLGLTEATIPALAAAASSQPFAENCYRRLVDIYQQVVGTELPQDPWEQLKGAVIAVFDSWNSDRARAYRAVENIPDGLGTGVTVQAMVFGNRSLDSGTGVLFTRDPSTGVNELFGDVMFNAQGEDVVAGNHATESIAELATHIPSVYGELRDYSDKMERHFADMCDIEFTIEHGRLWMLQVRTGKRTPQAALRIAKDMADDPDFPLSRREAVHRVAELLLNPPRTTTGFTGDAEALGEGLGASPGAASGHVVTDPAVAAERGGAGEAVILVRQETSPNDVHGMAKAAGILTATGGLASHAAVVARGWNIPAVVGAACVTIDDTGVTIDGHHLEADELITIDGGSGKIYRGQHTAESESVAEAPVLLAWAKELMVDLQALSDDSQAMLGPVVMERRGQVPLDADQVLRTLAVRGYGTPDVIAEALGATVQDIEALLGELIAAGEAAFAGGMATPTTPGRERGCALIAEDGRIGGIEHAEALLDAFVPLDKAIKDIVQAWQLVPTESGEPVFNDHTDDAYDRAVLDRVAGLHATATRDLLPYTKSFVRLQIYLARLDTAAAKVAAGNGQYIASPRLDSYHSVWFELHEELIGLAGTTRSAEVEAGRA
jgi:pyruvate,orthophosphate dikinase